MTPENALILMIIFVIWFIIGYSIMRVLFWIKTMINDLSSSLDRYDPECVYCDPAYDKCYKNMSECPCKYFREIKKQ